MKLTNERLVEIGCVAAEFPFLDRGAVMAAFAQAVAAAVREECAEERAGVESDLRGRLLAGRVVFNVVRNERERLEKELNYVYELEPDLKREGMEKFEGYFCHWNKIIHWAAKQGVSGYAQDPMELLATLVNQRDEAREGLQAKLLAVAEKCFIAGHKTAMGEEANYDSALKRWQESLVKMDLETECQQAPAGWQCTRETGHDGPCAAVESGVV